MNEALFQKLKKLLELSKRGSEYESELALTKAQAIAAEHGVDLAVAALAEEKTEPVEIVDEEFSHGTKRFPVFAKWAWWIVQEHYGVRIVLNGSRYSGRYLHFFGDKKDVEFAKYVYSFLIEDFERRWHYYRRSHNVETRMRSTWAHGVYKGLDSKLKESKEKAAAEKIGAMPEEIQGSVREKYALVLSDKNDAIKNAFAKAYPRLGTNRSYYSNHGGDHYDNGFATGRSMSINRPIGSQLTLT